MVAQKAKFASTMSNHNATSIFCFTHIKSSALGHDSTARLSCVPMYLGVSVCIYFHYFEGNHANRHRKG